MSDKYALFLVLGTICTAIAWVGLHILRWCKKSSLDGNERVSHYWVEKSLSVFASFFPVLFIVSFLRFFLYEPFRIPSESMLPTLEVGDLLLVNKFAYGVRDPIFHRCIFKVGVPQRGDVVVFKYPKDMKTDYIKRIVGLPGDKVSYVGKWLTVKRADTGEVIPVQQRFVRLYDAKHALFSALINRHEYQLLLSTGGKVSDQYFYVQPQYALGEWVVPEGHYFVMGDNRDNSEDSRFWGFVPETCLVGKGVYVWMSIQYKKTGWPLKLRFSRIGPIA